MEISFIPWLLYLQRNSLSAWWRRGWVGPIASLYVTVKLKIRIVTRLYAGWPELSSQQYRYSMFTI
jgi:hypothetical protein